MPRLRWNSLKRRAAEERVADDQHAPALADHLQRARDRADLGGVGAVEHSRPLLHHATAVGRVELHEATDTRSWPSSAWRSSSRSWTCSSSTSRSRTCGGISAASLAGLSWVLTAYAICFAAVLVPAGRLGDLYGRRKVFVIGLALFTLGSALCAIAPSVEALVAARIVQGVGAAALTPNSLGLVLPLFPPEPALDGDRRVGGDRRGRRLARAAAGRHPRRGQLAADLRGQRAARDPARSCSRSGSLPRSGTSACIASPTSSARCC